MHSTMSKTLHLALLSFLIGLFVLQLVHFIPAYKMTSWHFEYDDDQATDPVFVVKEMAPYLAIDPFYAKKYYNIASRQIGRTYALANLSSQDFHCPNKIPQPNIASRNDAPMFEHVNRDEAEKWLQCHNYLCNKGENEYDVAMIFLNKGWINEANYWMQLAKTNGYELAKTWVNPQEK